MKLFAGVLVLVQCGLSAQPDASGGIQSLWPVKSTHVFREALKPELGFSFLYDGKQVGPAIPADWRISSEPQPGGGTAMTFRHPSGLAVIRTSRIFPEAEAVEYTLRFRNESQSVLPAISAVNALDLTFAGAITKGLSAVTSGGGEADAVYPPKDFAVTRTWFGPLMPLDGQLTLAALGGNPSNVNLPMFFVENQAKAAGIFVSIGWSGQWKATLGAKFDPDEFRLRGGMQDLNLRLQPGEEIPNPLILVGAYRGPLSSGSNRLRRLMRDRYFPSVAGKRLVAPMMYDTWFDVGLELTDKTFRSLTDHAARLGQEILLLDAGWYKGVKSCPYKDTKNLWPYLSNPLGNWELGAELDRFPGGLPPLAEYARSKGMQFGLWFEPERCGPDSILVREHSDWLIQIPGRPWRMVNFGAPGVVEYFSKIFDRYISENGIRCINWDNNQQGLPYWQAADPPDRHGITEIRHTEGIHRLEEFVRRTHPETILINCAGGGQRIELRTLQRRHSIWISDQTMDPHIVRFHLEGLNQFLPGHVQMLMFAPPTSTYQKPGFVMPDIAFQSYFGGAFGLGGRLGEWPQALQDQARKHFQAYKKIRRFLAEDYYGLTPQARTLDGWEGWQFHDPNTDEGFVQAFRIESPEGARKLVLHALNPKATYRFSDLYTGKAFEANGGKVTSEGLQFDLPRMSSQVLVYRKI